MKKLFLSLPVLAMALVAMTMEASEAHQRGIEALVQKDVARRLLAKRKEIEAKLAQKAEAREAAKGIVIEEEELMDEDIDTTDDKDVVDEETETSEEEEETSETED